MKKPIEGEHWYFVDETGDPVFYAERGNLIAGTEGCSPILGIGFIETDQPSTIRQSIADLHDQIAGTSICNLYHLLPRQIGLFTPKMMLLKYVTLYIRLWQN